MEKSFPGKESHPPAETILAMVNMRKKFDRRALTHALIVSLQPRLGEPKCLRGEKLARL